MTSDLALLSTDQLRARLATENTRFTAGLTSGLSFESLKDIRINVKAIEAELRARQQ